MRDEATEPSVIGAFARLGAFTDRDAWTAKGWCSLESALEVVGTRSAMVLLREVYYGGSRFDDLARRAGLSEAVASARLKQLVADGLLTRQPYQEPGSRTRYEYVLTDQGRELFPLLVALIDFGRFFQERGAGVELVHAGCGGRLHASVVCSEGHTVDVAEVGAQLVREGLASLPSAPDGGA